jgi:tetratricopeptide (TPR) repeat protein
MKELRHKFFIPTLLLYIVLFPAHSQGKNGSIYDTREDSIECLKHLSAYREFVRLKLPQYALPPLWDALTECPASSEKMYVDAVNIYRDRIEEAPEGPVRESRIDTLMLIYDRRMEYFGGEGNVLGRKGRDILTYRGKDMDQVQLANEMLKRSITLEGRKSRESSLLLFVSSSITLNKEEIIDNNQVIDNYFFVIGILDQLEGRSSRWEKTRATVDEIMLNEDILTCEALDRYFEPLFEASKDDKDFLGKVIRFYNTTGCERSDMHVLASEQLYILERDPESAHNLAILFITRNDFQKAADYLLWAVMGENVDDETRAEWFYELTVVCSANQDYCDAIAYAREALRLKSDYGKAYIQLGDAFIATRDKLGDDFQQRTAYWAAADMYKKAASVDPTLEEEASQRLNNYSNQFPDQEEVFFRDMKDGDSYQVKGCINETTTVRSRK